MSLYNMLCGTNSQSDALLAMLGITRDNVPRFRDCYLENGKIVIYTRTGGGNREFYASEESCREANGPEFEPTGPFNSDLEKIPGYVGDEDDSFDSTFAHFRFEVPEKYKELAAEMAVSGDHTHPMEKIKSLLASLKTD